MDMFFVEAAFTRMRLFLVIEPSPFVRHVNSFCPGADMEFFVDVGNVFSNGKHAKSKFCRDTFSIPPVHKVLQYLFFSFAGLIGAPPCSNTFTIASFITDAGSCFSR
jgi:hypothetical protein